MNTTTLKKVARAIENHRLFQAGEKVVVAVSGGADSVALLDMLASLDTLGLDLVVAHLNHGLRGAESDGDAAFVAELADAYALPLELGKADVRALARQGGFSLEEAGRVARYRWLDTLAQKHRARRIALGHHADDQAETFLLRLFRGAGATGLRGMRPLTADKYARPLLVISRAEIMDYLERKGIPWRHDASNDDTGFLRNRIRHDCIPYLESYNPNIKERLNATAEILAADEEVLEGLVERIYGDLSSETATAVVLDLPPVASELPGIRFRLYRRALRTLTGDLARVAVSHLREIDALVFSSRVNGGFALPGGFRVRRAYGTLTFFRAAGGGCAEAWEVTIAGPGKYELPGGAILSVRLTAPPDDWTGCSPLTAFFDPRSTPFPWHVRTFRAGDRFRPFGMRGSRKVKDFFIDSKIPVGIRRRMPLLFRGEELIWVCGLRCSEQGRILPGTIEVAKVEISELPTYLSRDGDAGAFPPFPPPKGLEGG